MLGSLPVNNTLTRHIYDASPHRRVSAEGAFDVFQSQKMHSFWRIAHYWPRRSLIAFRGRASRQLASSAKRRNISS